MIRTNWKPCRIYLYLLNPFSFKTRISSRNGEIYPINSWFYVYNYFDKKIECYDINGDLVVENCLDNISEDVNQNYSFGYFNNWFIDLLEHVKLTR